MATPAVEKISSQDIPLKFPRSAVLTNGGAGIAVELYAELGKPREKPGDNSPVGYVKCGETTIWLPDIKVPRNRFKESIAAAFHVGAAALNPPPDIIFGMKRCGEHQEIPVDDLDGGSVSAAGAVTFRALLQPVKDRLMLERVGICAAIRSDGALERVGGESEKLRALAPMVRLAIVGKQWPREAQPEHRIELPLNELEDGRKFFESGGDPLRVVSCSNLNDLLARIRRVQACSAIFDR